MPRTLTVDDAEIPTLQRLLQKGNADLPTLPHLSTLTAKVAALSDPEPAPAPLHPAAVTPPPVSHSDARGSHSDVPPPAPHLSPTPAPIQDLGKK